ncbi:hypothetical protein Agabi119p4_5827 [Agaricus bisporus var. burnettii]|uniref:Uncharacterized protein n=1 Tax=Agaricus bisporus var. burnettii TaxID=192524 RepID=A0A8H7F2N8_AGABI|nr:hypothetical protein Agabi119p4_5827 [Agaricus bisporus var. burnettii]
MAVTALADGALLPLASLPIACRQEPDSGIRGVTPARVSLVADGLETTANLYGIYEVTGLPLLPVLVPDKVKFVLMPKNRKDRDEYHNNLNLAPVREPNALHLFTAGVKHKFDPNVPIAH